MKVKLYFYKKIGSSQLNTLEASPREREGEVDLWCPEDSVLASGVIEVEFEALDTRDDEIAKLRETKTAVRAKHVKEVEFIDDRINTLLALDYKESNDD